MNILCTNIKKLSIWESLYLLPKIDKKLYDIPGRPVISKWERWE